MKILNADKLPDLAAELVKAGFRVIAPQRVTEARAGRPSHVRFGEWGPGAAIDLSEPPVNSAKEFLFAPSEVIGRYTLAGDEFTLLPVEPVAPKTVLLGVRPCEAAALAAMDAVFNWDCRDEFYNARRSATMIVTAACTSADEHCFCTSVGGGPDSTEGADVMLRPSRDRKVAGASEDAAGESARFIVEPVSEKGQEVLRFAGAHLTEGDAKPAPVPDVPVRFNGKNVTEWLGRNFDSPRWEQWSLACLGCAACAYACPTCHCFDIQDEAGRSGGVRYRNWDACGLAMFTLHTSGHNPRPDQSARWRQRVMHKFRYFVEKFGRVACTGCGRCARLCPAGMAMLATAKAIDAEK